MHREPRHRLVLDSVRFRVLDVQLTPGDTTRFHIHDTAILYVDLGIAPVATQLLGGLWNPPGPQHVRGKVRIDSGYVQQSLTHRVTNVGGTLFRLLAITSSAPASGGASDTAPGLPGSIELVSTWYRQARVEVSPGSATEWRTSGRPVLVVQPESTGLEVEIEGAGRRRLEGPGAWLLIPTGSRYRIANGGMASIAAVAIQIR